MAFSHFCIATLVSGRRWSADGSAAHCVLRYGCLKMIGSRIG